MNVKENAHKDRKQHPLFSPYTHENFRYETADLERSYSMFFNLHINSDKLKINSQISMWSYCIENIEKFWSSHQTSVVR